MSLSTYPSAQGADGQFAVAYGYDNGQVANISDVVTGQQYWTLLESDQGYRLRRERFGNGAETLRTYKALSGRPDLITTSVPINGTPTVIQGISHAYDARSNLVSRTDTVVPTLSRSYQYDELDRLHIVSGSSGQLDSIDYDAIGNIMARSTVGQYVYGSSRPHAVTSAGSNTYDYNARGDQTVRSGPLVTGQAQTIDYDSTGMPVRVRGQGDVVEASFTYDADDRRALLTTGSGEATYYVGDLYEEQHTGDHVDHRYHVFAGGREVVQVERSFDGATLGPRLAKYLHTDALGSTDVVTDDSLSVTKIDFDAFGDVQDDGLAAAGVTAGFTGQRHDGVIGLIDLRARLYDPKLGRFVSADPIIGQPFFSQSLNHYSYALNNPLRFVDPRGLDPQDPRDPLDAAAAQDPSLRIPDYIKHGTVTTVSVEGPDGGEGGKENDSSKESADQALEGMQEIYGNRNPIQAPSPPPRRTIRPDPLVISVHLGKPDFGKPAGRIPLPDRVPPNPNDLVAMNKYGEPPGRRDRVFQLHKDAARAFRALRERAATAGFKREIFSLKSAFRDQARQNNLFKNAANPGRGTAQLSEHLPGRAMDFNLGIPNSLRAADEGKFDALKSTQWLRENAPDFGLNPYVAEPWHWSYNVVEK